jgi:hypothetical protein
MFIPGQLLGLFTDAEFELYMPYDKRNVITGIKPLPTGHGQANNVAGWNFGLASQITDDDADRANNASASNRWHRLSATIFFNLPQTSRYVAELGGTHTRRFVGVTGGYWNEINGIYYDVSDNPTGGATITDKMLAAFPGRYFIDLASGKGYAFALTGTFPSGGGGIAWASTNVINAFTFCSAYQITIGADTYTDFYLPTKKEMDDIILAPTTGSFTFDGQGFLSGTFGGPITNANRWHTSTYSSVGNVFYLSGSSPGQVLSHSTATNGLWLPVRQHLV